MRKLIPIAIILSLVLILFAGCLPKAPSEPVDYTSPKDTAQDDAIAQLQGRVDSVEASKANDSTVQSLNTRVTALEQNPATNTYTKEQLYQKADLYTQQEVNDLIQALKDDQSWITKSSGSSSSSGTTTGDYGELVDTDGDLELWIERVDPSSDDFTTDYGKNDGCMWFEFVVVNTGDSSHYFDLTCSITPDEDCRLWESDTEMKSPDLDWETDADFDEVPSSAPTNEDDCEDLGGDWDGSSCDLDTDYCCGFFLEEGDELDFSLEDREWIGADTMQGYRAELSIYQSVPYGSGDDVWWEYSWRIRQR